MAFEHITTGSQHAASMLHKGSQFIQNSSHHGEGLASVAFPSLGSPPSESKHAPEDTEEDELNWDLLFPFELDGPVASSLDEQRTQQAFPDVHGSYLNETGQGAECSDPLRAIAPNRNRDDSAARFILNEFSHPACSVKTNSRHHTAQHTRKADLDTYLEKASPELFGEVVQALLNLEKVLNLLIPPPEETMDPETNPPKNGLPNSARISGQFSDLFIQPHANKYDTNSNQAFEVESCNDVNPDCRILCSAKARPLSSSNHSTRRPKELLRTQSVASGLDGMSRHSEKIAGNVAFIEQSLSLPTQRQDSAFSPIISTSQHPKKTSHHHSYAPQLSLLDLFDENSNSQLFATWGMDNVMDSKRKRNQNRDSNICKNTEFCSLQPAAHDRRKGIRHLPRDPNRKRGTSGGKSSEKERDNTKAYSMKEEGNYFDFNFHRRNRVLSSSDHHSCDKIRSRRLRSLSHPNSQYDNTYSFPKHFRTGTEDVSYRESAGIAHDHGGRHDVQTEQTNHRNAPVTRRPRSTSHRKGALIGLESPNSLHNERSRPVINRSEKTGRDCNKEKPVEFHDSEAVENRLLHLDLSETDSFQIHRLRVKRNSGRCSRMVFSD